MISASHIGDVRAYMPRVAYRPRRQDGLLSMLILVTLRIRPSLQRYRASFAHIILTTQSNPYPESLGRAYRVCRGPLYIHGADMRKPKERV